MSELPKPASRIAAEAILRDLDDRSLGIECVDDETREEMVKEFSHLIRIAYGETT